MIATVARQHVRSLRRQHVFTVTMFTFVAMTVSAGAIGWSSHNTIVRVYDDATALLGAEGKPAPPNPFELVAPLAVLTNLVIYVPLIGSLVALIIGHLSVADDQATGIGRLIFTRRLRRSSYLAGKLQGTGAVLAIALAASWVVSVVSLRIANGDLPGIDELVRLAGFELVSWLYLMVFALIGLTTALATARRSLGLLSGLGAWLVITFALPQFTSGLRPTTSLNPVTDPVNTSQTFFQITANARPISISEQYKTIGAHLLGATTDATTADVWLRTLPILAALAALGALAWWLVSRHDYSRGTTDA